LEDEAHDGKNRRLCLHVSAKLGGPFLTGFYESSNNRMTRNQLKIGYFVLTGMNTVAASLFFNYLFFFLHDRFGFGDRENLMMSSLYGLIYIFSAWQCGRFAQRRGFHLSLKIGFTGLMIMTAIGAIVDSIAGMICVLIGYTIVLLFTWPALEALVCENETRSGVQHSVGIYNCTWSASAAFAYFAGGPLYDWLGQAAVFAIPAVIYLFQLVVLSHLSRKAAALKANPAMSMEPVEDGDLNTSPARSGQPANAQAFLRMAWLANPFAYVAMNTVVAVMPSIAQRLSFSPTQVGLFCSIWLFGRLAAFLVLWHWPGWHYRFSWLLSAFVILIGGFAALLLSAQLWIVIAAQLAFGIAAGLIYYSSLFYSMDVGEASAEHGGLHEAAIGIGIFAGPATGAAAFQFLPPLLKTLPEQLRPAEQNLGALAVTCLLLIGLTALLYLRWKFRIHRSAFSIEGQ
jgi:predicted MFS family arabinose efflux permease